MTLVYEQAWTCACGTENVRRFTCSACSKMRPPETLEVPAPSPPSAAAVAATVRTHNAVSKNLARACLAVVALIAALAGLGGYHAYRQHDAEQRVQAFVKGTKGAEFVASDLQFRATFPNAPKRETGSSDMNGFHVPYTAYTAAIGSDAIFGIARYDIPANARVDLIGAVNGSATGLKGRIESTTPTRFLGVDAIEAFIHSSEGYFKEVLFAKGGYGWHILVGGKADPPPGYDAFVSSFSLL